MHDVRTVHLLQVAQAVVGLVALLSMVTPVLASAAPSVRSGDSTLAMSASEAASSGVSAPPKNTAASDRVATPDGPASRSVTTLVVTWFDWLSLTVGVVSLGVSGASAVFAYRASTKSDRLLRRLVVYPYRNLDVEYSNLTDEEQSLLLQVTRLQKGQRGVAAEDLLSGTLRESEIVLATRRLTASGWLSERESGLILNPDRAPYLNFVRESLHGS